MFIGILAAILVLAGLMIYFQVRAELRFRKLINKMEGEENEARKSHRNPGHPQ